MRSLKLDPMDEEARAVVARYFEATDERRST